MRRSENFSVEMKRTHGILCANFNSLYSNMYGITNIPGIRKTPTELWHIFISHLPEN